MTEEEATSPRGRSHERLPTDGRSFKNENRKQKEEPNFEPSGLLAAETNTKNGVVLKYCLPPEARPPTERWRLYMFKKEEKKSASEGEEPTKVLHIHRLSSYLIGKDRRVCDIYLLHPTISKQHAAITYRLSVTKEKVLPYLMDLDSTNGTFLNGERIEACRQYELQEQDTIRFGRSSREYVLLHARSVAIDSIEYDEYVEIDKQRRLEEKREKEAEQLGRELFKQHRKR